MQSYPHLWITLLTKLGLTPKCRHVHRKNSFARRLHFEQCEDRRMLATLTVTSLADNTTPGDGFLTLREAINAANQDNLHDTIKFDSSLANQTITLTEGDLTITESVTIDGRNSSGVSLGITIDASGNDSTPLVKDGLGTGIFHKSLFSGGSADIEIHGLTLTGGDAPSAGGAIYIANGNLTLKNTTITGNAAIGTGGGVHAHSALAV